jgi:hypothetical protein
MAPYRCHDCGARFVAHSYSKAVRRSHEQSLVEYVGLQGRESKIRQWVITIAMTLILLAVSLVLLLRALDI